MGSILKQKNYVLTALLAGTGGTVMNTAMIGSSVLGVAQGHSQGVQAEEAAEEQARLQRKMNKQLKRIADSADPAAGQQAASVLQGQTAFSMSEDVGNDLDNGIKKAGNVVGGATGTVAGGMAGGALGTAVGAGIGAKMAKSGLKGAGKGGLIGAAAGVIGGSILGGASGSSMFSDTRVGSVLSEKLYAAGELTKLGKGLFDVAMKHKGTVAEGLAAGGVMAGSGYLANKAINKENDDKEAGKEGGMSAGTKMALGAGTALLGAMALKKGANYGLIKGAGRGTMANQAINRGASAIKTGVGFGTALAALPYAIQKSQESKMQENAGEEKKDSGLGKKLLIGGALAAGTALGGYKLAKGGYLTKGLQKSANNLSTKIEGAKVDLLGKLDKSGEAVKARSAYKAEQEAAKKVSDTYKEATFLGEGSNKTEYVVDKLSQLAGAGTQKTQKLADQLMGTESEYLKKAGQFMKDHKKTALVAAAPLGYAAGMGSWGVGEKVVNAPLKKLDPDAYKNEDNI